MNFKIYLLFCLLSTSLTSSFAEAQTAWEQLFQSTFYNSSVYVENHCTENVLRYLRMARAKGLDISKVEAIELTDYLDFVTGHNVRTDNLDKSSNWYHHVILKVGNTILDYDFTNQPTPAPLYTYFHSMFMNERMKKDKEYCLKRMRSLKLTIFTGSDYLKRYDDKIHSDRLNKKETYIKDTGWICR